MTNTSKTLIFFGNEQLASGVATSAPILTGLIESGYNIPFIILSQNKVQSRNSKMLKVVEVAGENNIEIKYIDKLSAIEGEIKNSGAELGVLAAFGKIVPQSTIDLFKFGIINAHPSLLPKYRGSSPIESAIISGDQKTGVSIMSLTAGMDEGPVYGYSEVDINNQTTKQGLFDQLSELGTKMMVEFIPKILEGSYVPLEQDHSNATYTEKLSKTDSEINWSESANKVRRKVVAYLGWPGSKTKLGDNKITITDSLVIKENGKSGEPFMISKSRFGFYCGKDAIEVLKLKPAGKPEMSAQAFLAGNKIS